MANAGEGLVVSSKGPGIFLQGLAVHGNNGRLLPGTVAVSFCCEAKAWLG